MATYVPAEHINTVLFYNLIFETSRLITETPPKDHSISSIKKQTSYFLRSILLNVYRSLMISPQTSDEDSKLINDCMTALIMNIHTRYDTRPVLEILETPSEFF